MMRWLHKGMPLPFASINNLRSLVALDNLLDLIVVCLEHSAAVNQTFLVSDGEDLSTTELLHRMAHALGRPARLVPIPVYLLEAGAALLGRRDIALRLCGSLQVDISKVRSLLGWNPPISVDEGLHRTAQGFLHERIV
jgi:UDP-glucose 4-epimerase